MSKHHWQYGNLRWLLLSLGVVAVDLGSKWYMSGQLTYLQPVAVMPYLNWTLSHNWGSAFGFLNGAGNWTALLFSVIALTASVCLLIWLLRLSKQDKFTAMGLSLILGGAIGNAVDRLRFGYVVDFIDVYVQHWHWPTFNIADSAICLGVLLLCLTMWRES